MLSKWVLNTILFALMSVAQVALAKPMPQRLGVGIKDNTVESIPSIYGLYNLSDDFSFYGGMGIDTQKDYSKLAAHVGIRHIIFHENSLHFYTGGQFALIDYETPATGKDNGYEFQFLFGTEIFLAGLENVGFSIEGGVGVSSFEDTRVRTVANSPFKAGILFYF